VPSHSPPAHLLPQLLPRLPQVNISLVVDGADGLRAVRALHSEFFEGGSSHDIAVGSNGNGNGAAAASPAPAAGSRR
jgi:hypothetical protein